MFRTLFTVEKKVCGSTEFTTLFEDYGKAKQFAVDLVNNLTEKENQDFAHWSKKYFDGSMLVMWMSNRYEISIDDNAWITDFRTDGIRFHDHCGIVTEFDSIDSLKEYIKSTQRLTNTFS